MGDDAQRSNDIQRATAREGGAERGGIACAVEREAVYAVVPGTEEDTGATSTELSVRITERTGSVG